MNAWQALEPEQQAKLHQLRTLLHEVADDALMAEAVTELWLERPVRLRETAATMREHRRLAVQLHGLPEQVSA